MIEKNAGTDASELNEVLAGLSLTPKQISAKWFYDSKGSYLFEQITALPEYYLTRTESSILKMRAGEMAELIGPDALIVEYGAGALRKVRNLLDAMPGLAGYVPIDISADFLRSAAEDLREDYPELTVHPLGGDFLANKLPPLGDLARGAGRITGFFPGSTIGNFLNLQMIQFFRNVRDHVGADGRLLIGFDMRKPLDVLIPAYDDAVGVTAKFNLNILTSLNNCFGANFDLDLFAHRVCWQDEPGRIEMHLQSLCDQSVEIGGQAIAFQKGETIRTEISRKFMPGELERIAFEAAGWTVVQTWEDNQGWYTIALLQ